MIFAMFSCKENENGGNNGTDVGDNDSDDVFSSDAIWDNGSTVTVYSDSKMYSELLDLEFFDELESGTDAVIKWNQIYRTEKETA